MVNLNPTGLPSPPASLYLVGIGGIGMSGLAQFLLHEGYRVSGSDRGLSEPGKAELYQALLNQGIKLYPQDGSGITAEKPDALIVSTAVEENTPDLLAANSIPRLHRARALSLALARHPGTLLTVAGSCGKTTVTGWLASALHALGQRVLVVNGGYYAGKLPDNAPGNFMADDNPDWLVAEVDESDKSIAEFTPDYAILLNVGNDHYEQDELRRVFAAYLARCRHGAVLPLSLAGLANGIRAQTALFSPEPVRTPGCLSPLNYHATPDGIVFDAPGFGRVTCPQSGRHSAGNACAVLAMLQMLMPTAAPEALAAALAAFPGIRQRFEVMGTTPDGITVVNDYAHNPEKLCAAIATAHERFGGRLLIFFQPHGFKPLAFMREALVNELRNALMPDDCFAMLPVFYAGGTASFSPSSDEVAAELAASGLNAIPAAREDASRLIASANPDAVLVLGARDSSLRPWTASLCKPMSH